MCLVYGFDSLQMVNISPATRFEYNLNNHFINEGCYEDVFELSGTPQMFIQKSVVGGRVMCNNNKMCINHTDRNISACNAEKVDVIKECDRQL